MDDTWEKAVARAEAAGTRICECGFEYYRTTDMCPLCNRLHLFGDVYVFFDETWVYDKDNWSFLNGEPIPAVVREFIEEYNGKTFAVTFPINDRYLPFETEFNIQEVLDSFDGCWIERYTNFLNKNVWPIGTSDNGHTMLFMDEDGKIYGGQDDFICLLGKCKEEALSNILSGIHVNETNGFYVMDIWPWESKKEE